MASRKVALALAAMAGAALLAGKMEIAMAQPPQELLGKWGYIVLGKGGKGSWFGYKTEAGTMNFNENYTIVNNYKESADRCPDENYCMKSAHETLSYSVGESGVIVIGETVKCFLSESKTVILCDGTTGMERSGEKFFIAGLKLDTQTQYEDSALLGEYFTAYYEKDLLGEDRGKNRLGSVIGTIESSEDGLEITSASGWENDEKGGDKIHRVNFGPIPLQFSPDGSFQLGGFATGYLGIQRNMAVVSNPSQFYPDLGDDFAVHVLLRRNDRDYSQQDLSGRWAFVGFGDKAAQTYRAEIGIINCDSNGSCVFSSKVTPVNGTSKFHVATRTITVSSTGELNGFHLSTNKPHISGAIGDNGNTMILLMNEDSQSINDRLLAVAVRYPDGNLPGFSDLELKEVLAPDTASPGEKITISYTVENKGEEAATKSARVSFRLVKQDGSEDMVLGTQRVPKLDHGELFNGSKNLRLKKTLTPGNYSLRVSLDPTNAIFESREDNNEKILEISITSGS
ncbi:MAG: CARDB domain-containing protein [bacterium]